MDVFKKTEFDALNEELQELLYLMDVPEKRRTDLRWLCRNLKIMNGHIPEVLRADEILRELLKNEEL